MQTYEIKNQEAINYLESLSVEIETRKDVVAFMLDSKMDTDSEQFRAYHRELVEFREKFEIAKNQFYQDVVLPLTGGKPVDWSLDYRTAVLSVMERPA